MRLLGLSVWALIGWLSVAFAQTTVFTNVNVVPMDRPEVLEGHVVIVDGQSIVAIGPSGQIDVPTGSNIIDGRGGYLMPGLAVMHMHLVGDRSYSDPEQLLFFLAQGTTTIRALGAPPIALQWREQVRSGDLVGPKILVMGPTLVGNYDDANGIAPVILGMNLARLLIPLVMALVIMLATKRWRSIRAILTASALGIVIGGVLVASEWPRLNILNPLFDVPQSYVLEDRSAPVKATVSRYAAEGYDGVKLYDGLTEQQFMAGIAEADRQGLYTTGHLLHQVPLDQQLASGLKEVAHVDEFLSHHWIGYNLGRDPDPRYVESFDFPVDMAGIPKTAEMVAEGGLAVVSNMSTDEALYRLLLDLDGTLNQPRFAEFRPDIVNAWRTEGRHFGPFAGQGAYRRDEIQPFLSTLVKAMHDAEIPILIGTDAGGFAPEGSIPSDIHRELELLVDAGLTNFEALSAGTRTAGQIVAAMTGEAAYGTVKEGSAADLMLLTENPLDSVSATRQRVGAMKTGIWYPQEKLNQMVTDYLSAREW